MMHWDYGWGLGPGWIFMVLFWALVILGVVYLLKLVSGGTKSEKQEETALDILRKRYARGEISKEEFEEYVQDFTEAGLLRPDRLIMIENARKHRCFKEEGVAYITTPLAWPHAEFIRTYNLYKQVFKVKR